jgi:hypothetical protein
MVSGGEDLKDLWEIGRVNTTDDAQLDLRIAALINGIYTVSGLTIYPRLVRVPEERPPGRCYLCGRVCRTMYERSQEGRMERMPCCGRCAREQLDMDVEEELL